jgi:large subunit ribosomal protein L9
MPAGANGKLYGAVTSQTIADEFAKQGHHIERKRIELAGTSFKSVGKYKVTVKLYESAAAEITVTVQGHVEEAKTPAAPSRRGRPEGRGGRRDEEAAPAETAAPAGEAGGITPAEASGYTETAPAGEPAAQEPAVQE